MLDNLKIIRMGSLENPVYGLAGVEWESWKYPGAVELRRERPDGVRVEISLHKDGKVYARLNVKIGHGETASISELHQDADSAAAWALAFQPVTREAGGAVWVQTSNLPDYQTWETAAGPKDTLEIARHKDPEDWSVERTIWAGARIFRMTLTGFDRTGYRNEEGDGRIKSFEEAAHAALGIFRLMAGRAGDQYRQGFEDGRQALKAAIAEL